MKKLLSILIIASITACSTTPVKEQAVKIGDAQMSCQQITSENARLDESLKTINSKKGFNGTNAAAVLFFIPGIIYTYYDAGQAIDAVQKRRDTLNAMYNQKNCAAGGVIPSMAPSPYGTIPLR